MVVVVVVHSWCIFCSSAKTLRGRKDTLVQVYFYWGGGQSPPSPPRDRRHCPSAIAEFLVLLCKRVRGWLSSRVVGVLDSGAEGPGFKSQSRRCRVTVLGKLFTPIVPLFIKQKNW